MAEKVLDYKAWKISPTQMTTFEACQFLWYTRNVLDMRDPPNRHMLRGTIFHSAVENLWKFKPENWEDLRKMSDYGKPLNLPSLGEEKVHKINDFPFSLEALEEVAPAGMVSEFSRAFRRYGAQIFNEAWVKYRPQIIYDIKEFDMMYPSTFIAFMKYVDDQILGIETYSRDKGRTYKEAYSRMRPYRREKKFHSKEGTEVGIIDAIMRTDYGDIIADYKTSSLWGSGHKEDYYSQLCFYAYLYLEETGDLPRFVEINYVMYGIRLRYRVDIKDVLDIKNRIDSMRASLKSIFEDKQIPVKNTKYEFCYNCWAGQQGICDRNGEKVDSKKEE